MKKRFRIFPILIGIACIAMLGGYVQAQVVGGNYQNVQRVVNVNGNPMLKDTGQLFSILQVSKATTVAVNTTCAIDWIWVTNLDSSNAHYFEIADGKTVAAVTSGNKSAPYVVPPAGTQPNTVLIPLMESPIPISNKLVIYCDSTTLCITGKYHKVGGK